MLDEFKLDTPHELFSNNNELNEDKKEGDVIDLEFPKSIDFYVQELRTFIEKLKTINDKEKDVGKSFKNLDKILNLEL